MSMSANSPEPKDMLERMLTAPLHRAGPLFEQGQLFGFTFAHTPLGQLIRMPHQGMYAANQAFCELCGYSEDELARLSPQELTSPDEAAGLEAGLAQLIAGAQSGFSCELRMRHKAGRAFWAQLAVSALQDGLGQFQGIMVQASDISGQKRWQQTLAARQQRQDRAVALAQLGCWEIDIATGSFYRSDEMLSLMGAENEPNEVPFSQARLGFHPDDRKRLTSLVQEAIALNHSLGPTEARVRHADGKLLNMRIEALIVTDREGQPAKLLGYMLDVTESGRQERRLRAANLRLEHQNEQIRALAREVSLALRGSFTELRARALALSDLESDSPSEPESGT